METTCVSQRRATSGDIQPGHVHALQLQQELLVGHASGVACQTSVAAHNPVTGDHSYLENHYGITYDHSKYLISYEVHASNLMPDIDVIFLTNKGELP